MKREAERRGLILNDDAVQATVWYLCAKGICGSLITGLATGAIIDNFVSDLHPEGGFYSKPFIHTVQWVSVESGLMKPKSLSYQ